MKSSLKEHCFSQAISSVTLLWMLSRYLHTPRPCIRRQLKGYSRRMINAFGTSESSVSGWWFLKNCSCKLLCCWYSQLQLFYFFDWNFWEKLIKTLLSGNNVMPMSLKHNQIAFWKIFSSIIRHPGWNWLMMIRWTMSDLCTRCIQNQSEKCE